MQLVHCFICFRLWRHQRQPELCCHISTLESPLEPTETPDPQAISSNERRRGDILDLILDEPIHPSVALGTSFLNKRHISNLLKTLIINGRFSTHRRSYRNGLTINVKIRVRDGAGKDADDLPDAKSGLSYQIRMTWITWTRPIFTSIFKAYSTAITSTLTMASNRDRSSATWSRDDVATLVHTLAEEKAKGNWVDNRPQGVAWTSCEQALMNSERTSGGGVKTLQSIQNRWQRVRPRGLPSYIRLSRVYPA